MLTDLQEETARWSLALAKELFGGDLDHVMMSPVVSAESTLYPARVFISGPRGGVVRVTSLGELETAVATGLPWRELYDLR